METISSARCSKCGAGFNYERAIKGPPRRRCDECRWTPGENPGSSRLVTMQCQDCQREFTYEKPPGKGRNRNRCDGCCRKGPLNRSKGTKAQQVELALWRIEKEVQQDYRCAICGETETTPNRNKSGGINRLAVDHNHETGELRGLLCLKCNVMVGLARESPRILSAALSYLETHTSGGN